LALTPFDEAIAYLTQRLQDPDGELPDHVLDQAAQLADDLGCHPLALAQAAAVIHADATTTADYRTRLTTQPLKQALPTNTRADGYDRTLHQTWELVLQRADADTDGLAGPLLLYLAVLDPTGAPDTLLTTPALHTHLDSAEETSAGRERGEMGTVPRTVLDACRRGPYSPWGKVMTTPSSLLSQLLDKLLTDRQVRLWTVLGGLAGVIAVVLALSLRDSGQSAAPSPPAPLPTISSSATSAGTPTPAPSVTTETPSSAPPPSTEPSPSKPSIEENLRHRGRIALMEDGESLNLDAPATDPTWGEGSGTDAWLGTVPATVFLAQRAD
jgi:hypothetical protein